MEAGRFSYWWARGGWVRKIVVRGRNWPHVGGYMGMAWKGRFGGMGRMFSGRVKWRWVYAVYEGAGGSS
jgi:hypothetical protein